MPTLNHTSPVQARPRHSQRPLLASALAVALIGAWPAFAQSTATSPAGSEVVKLSAFEVSDKAPNRYQAAEVTSGGRLRTAIFDSPQTINVVTEALLKVRRPRTAQQSFARRSVPAALCLARHRHARPPALHRLRHRFLHPQPGPNDQHPRAIQPHPPASRRPPRSGALQSPTQKPTAPRALIFSQQPPPAPGD